MLYLEYLRNRYTDLSMREDGATAVEYALMVALIAVVIIASVIFLGETISDTFSEVGTNIRDAGD